MRINTYGKNIDVTNGMKKMAEEKLGKLECYFKPETDIYVTFSVQGGRQKVEVTIPLKGTTIHAEEESEDMYASIDMIEDTIERQLRRYKKKLIDKQQAAANFAREFVDTTSDSDEEIRIVKSKKFALKPMDVEEACIQMELLNHNFFVFRNAETDDVNVVYKRKDGAYGLIEPEI